jgi:hypothetical protein
MLNFVYTPMTTDGDEDILDMSASSRSHFGSTVPTVLLFHAIVWRSRSTRVALVRGIREFSNTHKTATGTLGLANRGQLSIWELCGHRFRCSNLELFYQTPDADASCRSATVRRYIAHCNALHEITAHRPRQSRAFSEYSCDYLINCPK